MIRWYLQKPTAGQGLWVVVERVSDKRGYRLLCSDRHVAREELPHLKRLVASISPEPRIGVRFFDPADVGP